MKHSVHTEKTICWRWQMFSFKGGKRNKALRERTPHLSAPRTQAFFSLQIWSKCSFPVAVQPPNIGDKKSTDLKYLFFFVVAGLDSWKQYNECGVYYNRSAWNKIRLMFLSLSKVKVHDNQRPLFCRLHQPTERQITITGSSEPVEDSAWHTKHLLQQWDHNTCIPTLYAHSTIVCSKSIKLQPCISCTTGLKGSDAGQSHHWGSTMRKPDVCAWTQNMLKEQERKKNQERRWMVWITCRLLFDLKDELKGTIRFSISWGWNTKPAISIYRTSKSKTTVSLTSQCNEDSCNFTYTEDVFHVNK